MLDDLLPLHTVVSGTKQVGLFMDIEERRNHISKRRVYMTRYGRVSYEEVLNMQLSDLQRFLRSLSEIVNAENMVSSLNER